MAQNLEDAIHNALKARLRAATFPKVTYDKTTGARTTAALATVKAKSAYVQPVTATYEGATDKSAWLMERSDWQWIAEIKFSNAVSTEDFESDLTQNPIKISRTESSQDRQVLVALEDVSYEIPPTGQPASGTRVAMRFSVILSPK